MVTDRKTNLRLARGIDEILFCPVVRVMAPRQVFHRHGVILLSPTGTV